MDVEQINQQYGNPAETSTPSNLDAIKSKYSDSPVAQAEVSAWTHGEDFLQAIPKGIAGALRETTKTVFGEETDTPFFDWVLENTGKMETPTGNITEGLTKFISFYAGPGKIFAPFKTTGMAGSIAQTTFRGGMTDAFTLGKDDQRLSHTLKGMDWDNELISYLASPSEGQYEDKFKHFVEGGILGLGVDTAVVSSKAIFGAYRWLKEALKASGKTDSEIREQLQALSEEGALSHQNISETVEKLQVEASSKEAEGPLTEAVEFNRLPKDLRGAAPKFQKANIAFKNDFEKALYIMGNTKTPSKRHNDYLEYALKESGMPRESLLLMSKAMRLEVKQAAAQGREVDFSHITKANKEVTKRVTQGDLDAAEVTAKASGANVEQLMNSLTAPNVKGTKPPETTINYEKTSFGHLETDEAKRMIEANANKSQVQSNDITKAGAAKILKEQSMEDILTKGVNDVSELAEYDVAVRTILSSAGNTMEVAMKGAKSADDRLDVLLDSPELLLTVLDTASVTQEMGTKIARAMQSRNIAVDSKAILKVVKGLAPLLNKAANARKLIQEGGEALPLLTKEELVTLEKHMEELLALTSTKAKPLKSPLAKLDPKDSGFTKMWHILTEIKLAGQLSAFTTQAAAAIGTGIKRVSFKMENRYAYALGAIMRDSDRLKWNEVNALNATEFKKVRGTLGMMKNMLKSIPDSNIKAEETMQRTSLDGFITKLDEQTSQAAITKEYLAPNLNPDSMMGNFLGGTIDTLGAVNRLPFAMLSLQDDAAKRMFYLPHINYLSITEGNKKGLKGADLTNYVDEVGKTYELFYLKRGNREFGVMQAISGAQKEAKKLGLDGQALDDYLMAAKDKAEAKLTFTEAEKALVEKHIKPEWHNSALESGRDMTFQSELKGDSITNRVINAIAEAREIHPTVKWVLPYYKTVINMTKEVARRTPGIHKFSETMQADLKAGGRRKRMAQAKLIQGTSMYVLGYNLVSEGYITPTSDRDNYQVMKDAGVSEASIQMPWMDKPIPLNRIEPIGTYLLMMAELGKATDNVRRMNIQSPAEMADRLGEIAGLYSAAFADVFVNKTMMDSVDQFTRALDDPESTYWSNLAVTVAVPGSNFVRSFTQEQGDILKEAKTAGEVFTKALGAELAEQLGISDGTPLRDELNLLGEPQGNIEKYYGYRTKLVKDNAVLTELYKVGADVKKITKSLAEVGIPIELDHKDHYKLQLYVKASGLEANLATLFKSKAYADARLGYSKDNETTKKWLINEIVKESHKAAREAFKANEPKVIKEIKKGLAQKLKEMQNDISENTAKPARNFFEFQNK